MGSGGYKPTYLVTGLGSGNENRTTMGFSVQGLGFRKNGESNGEANGA